MTIASSPAVREGFIKPLDGVERVEAWGVRIAIVVSSTDTGGKYTVMEYTSPPTGIGPALHLHREMEETFHVLEGQLHFQLGSKRLLAKPGTMVHAPAGVPHAFWNTGPGDARMLVTFSPGGFENYMLELLELARANPHPTPDIRQLLGKIGDQYDQVVLGPPPGAKA